MRNAIKDQNHVFVYYYQINCLHCKRVSPYLIPMGEKINGKFLILNIEGDQKSWESYKINQTPTLVVYKNGRETNRIEGEQTKNRYKNFLIRKVEHVSIAIISIIMLYSGFMKLFDVYGFMFSLQYYQYIPESMYLIIGFAVPIIEIMIAFLIWVKRFRYFL
ncbi:thioredoxin family protein [Bacillus velezensis]